MGGKNALIEAMPSQAEARPHPCHDASMACWIEQLSVESGILVGAHHGQRSCRPRERPPSSNLLAPTLDLNDDEMARISALDCGERLVNPNELAPAWD